MGTYLRLKVMEKVPIGIFRNLIGDSNLTILKLFGRKSEDKDVALAAAVTAISSGISEEVFFRGFCYTVIANAFGDMKALIASSSIFALAHFAVFRSNPVAEFFYGMLLALLFTTSGYNLFVPIVAHSLHNFFHLFVTWKYNSSTLCERVITAKTANLSNEVSKDPLLFQSTSRTVSTSHLWHTYLLQQYLSHLTMCLKQVFDYFDVNGDGLIDEEDLARGIYNLK